MTSLEPAGQLVDALRALLDRVQGENVMGIDAVKESDYLARDGRRRWP